MGEKDDLVLVGAAVAGRHESHLDGALPLAVLDVGQSGGCACDGHIGCRQETGLVREKASLAWQWQVKCRLCHHRGHFHGEAQLRLCTLLGKPLVLSTLA